MIFQPSIKRQVQEALSDRFGWTDSGLWWRLIPRREMFLTAYPNQELPPEITDMLSHQGFANGYVGIPKNHPWYGNSYDDLSDVAIHGGLTFAEPEGEYLVIGFDTAHFSDNPSTINEEFCYKELMNLLQQAENAWNTSIPA